MVKKTDPSRKRLQRLFRQVLPKLLSKPASHWTKQEVWSAIELYFKRPNWGLINFDSYSILEAKLKGEPVDCCHPLLPRKSGRPQRFPAEESRRHWEAVQQLRQQIATENGVAITAVKYTTVAQRMAEESFAKRGLNPPNYKVKRLRDRYVPYYKALNKKRKAGEI